MSHLKLPDLMTGAPDQLPYRRDGRPAVGTRQDRAASALPTSRVAV